MYAIDFSLYAEDGRTLSVAHALPGTRSYAQALTLALEGGRYYRALHAEDGRTLSVAHASPGTRSYAQALTLALEGGRYCRALYAEDGRTLSVAHASPGTRSYAQALTLALGGDRYLYGTLRTGVHCRSLALRQGTRSYAQALTLALGEVDICSCIYLSRGSICCQSHVRVNVRSLDSSQLHCMAVTDREHRVKV